LSSKDAGAWYEKFLPYRPVRRGDIIVFKFPFDDSSRTTLKTRHRPCPAIASESSISASYINGEYLEEGLTLSTIPWGADSFGDGLFLPPSRHFSRKAALRAQWANAAS